MAGNNLYMEFYEIFQLKNLEIKEKFISNYEIGFRCYKLDFKEEEYLAGVLKICLLEIGKEKLFDYMNFIYRELLDNARKANTKRVFFDDLQLNIHDKNSYNKGMKKFKHISSKKLEKYLKIQEEKNYYVNSKIIVDNDDLKILITNNVEILDEELATISNMKKNAHEFNSIEEAIEQVSNNLEGAGLGIVIIILMLKKIGLTEGEFEVIRNKGKTISSVTLPLSLITFEQRSIINDILLNEIEKIPQFPNHILELQKKLNDPDVNIKEISGIISRDPGLTGEVIKFSNSAFLSTINKITTTVEAIKIIGLRGLKNIIYSYGTKTVFEKRYNISKMHDIFKHSFIVAFLSFYLAKLYSLKKEKEYDTIYVSGILHDLGKIIMMGINPDLLIKINKICHEKEIPIRIIEELASGYNHQAIGALLAKKWHFPDNLIASIKYHHSPIDCSAEHREIVYCVYLANLISKNDVPILHIYNEIYDDVLNFFKINSITDYEKIYNDANNKLNIYMKKTSDY